MGEVVLADTSAWVEYLRATGSPVHQKLVELIRTDSDLCITEPIAMELLAGAVDRAGRWDLQRLLLRFRLLSFDSTADFPAAAAIYRRCRANGFTPRNFLDCMVASVALRQDAAVLARDSDFERIAQATGLRLAAGS